MTQQEGMAKLSEKPSDQALLAEYAACEQYIESAANRDWQVAAIIWGASLAGLFFVAMEENVTLATLVVVTSLYPFVLACIWLFWRMVKRMVFFQSICVERMQKIESELIMKRSIYLYLLDNWGKRDETTFWRSLPEDEKTYLEKVVAIRRAKGAPRPTTEVVTYIINWIIAGAWSVLIILEWLTYLAVIN